MPLFIDRHDPIPEMVTFTKNDFEEGHKRDLAVQEKYGVNYITGLIDAVTMKAFCIVEAPSKEAAEAVHREAHGVVANRIIEIDPSVLEIYLEMGEAMTSGQLRYDSSLRAILFTDMEDSTAIVQRMGDEKAMEVRHEHDAVVRGSLRAGAGREIKHTGDGIMGCFSSVVRAVECSIKIQKELGERKASGEFPARVRVGMTAGEPVTEEDDLFGTSVNLARRICDVAEPGSILASWVVRELSMGKSFKWEDRGEAQLKGFDEPIRLHRLIWE